MRNLRWVALALVVLGAGGACATTKPYERELLARPAMAVERDADRLALEAHVITIQEGAVGGSTGGGGGCGCN